MPSPLQSNPAAAQPDSEWLSLVRTQVERLRYGVVQLVVHDGRVTQIEFTERTRLGPGGQLPATREQP
jgi:hypothetical protein